MPIVRFQPSGATATVDDGASVLDAAIAAGATDITCCGKLPLCGQCRMAVLDGDDHLSTPEPDEAEHRLRRRFLPYERLACTAYVRGDVEVELPK